MTDLVWMTDLEITKLCADAMRYVILDWDNPDVIDRLGIWCDDPETGRKAFIYDPLGIRGREAFDAQAMALVKECKLGIAYSGHWSVYEQGNGKAGHNANLNRAICECVAKMQKAKVAA